MFSNCNNEVTFETTFLKAAAWLASDAAMSAVHVKDSSLREASPTPPMMGMRAAYTMGWSMSCGVQRRKRGNVRGGERGLKSDGGD